MTRRAIAALAGCVTVLALAGCGAKPPAETTTEPVVPVRVAELRTAPFEDNVEAPGVWRTSGELVIAAPFTGVIETLTARVGDAVEKGQTLGTLVSRESQAALRGAQIMEREAHDPAAKEEAQRAVQLARAEMVRVPLTAAEAGVVVRRSVEPGAQAAEGSEVLAIDPWSELVFEARISPAASGRIRVGQHAVVNDPGLPPRPAVVGRILPTVDENDQSTVVQLTPLALKPPPSLGRYSTTAIAVGGRRFATAVPDSAIVEDDVSGVSTIAVVDTSHRVHWVRATLGATSPGWHELRSPTLPPGTQVVIDGQRGLADSTRVSWP